QLGGTIKRGEVADLGDQPGSGQGVDATQAPQPRDGWRPRAAGRLPIKEPLEPLATCEQHLMTGQVLAEDDLDQRIREPDAPKPLDMPLGPRRTGPIPNETPAQQQLADAMPA